MSIFKWLGILGLIVTVGIITGAKTKEFEKKLPSVMIVLCSLFAMEVITLLHLGEIFEIISEFIKVI